MATERLRLADGEHDQTLVPGVAPVTTTARDLAALEVRRAARRVHGAPPKGGLFDETGRDQLWLL